MSDFWLSVIVSTSVGRASHLHFCLTALSRQTFTNFEVLVCDDGSDGMEKVLANFEGSFRRLSYQHRPSDFNLSRSRNQGAALARGEGLLFLNGDILLNPRALAAYVDTLSASPEALCWGYTGCRKRESAPSLWFPGVEVNWLDFRFFPCSETQLWLNPTLAHAPHTLAGGHHFGLTRRSWEALGPLDESFVYWGEEDVEYALRGLLQQRPMILLGDAWSEHQVHGCQEPFHQRAQAELGHKFTRIVALEQQLAGRSLQPLVRVIFTREQALFYQLMQTHYLRHNPGALAREMGGSA